MAHSLRIDWIHLSAVGLLLLAAAGAYAGHEASAELGLRSGLPDAAYGPLTGAAVCAALGMVAFFLALAAHERRRAASQPASQLGWPSVDWQEFHDPDGGAHVDVRPSKALAVCGLCYSIESCECPRCDFCGETGKPGCYASGARLNHGLHVSPAFLERRDRLVSMGVTLVCSLCRSRSGCECPRCDVCGRAGDLACYASPGSVNHGLERRDVTPEERRTAVLPSVDWREMHDPADAPGQRPRGGQSQEPPGLGERLSKLFQPPPPGPNSAKFIGPRLPMTLEMAALRTRNDDMPLRAPRGGRLTAAEYPDILERQWHEWRQMFGGRGASFVSKPTLIAALALGTLVLAIGGYMLGPQALGSQGGSVAGTGSMFHSLAPYLGLLAGLAAGSGGSWWALFKWSGGKDGGETGSRWDQVYAPARITQVEYRDDAGRVVAEDAPDARRYVVRRMNTHLQRAAFAGRQEGVFVSGEKLSKEQRFRKGEIRLETTKDLSKLTKPQELYDARHLPVRGRGVSSVRWYVGLRNPIETGIAAREWDLSVDKSAWARRFIAATYGWWILLAGIAAGIILVTIILDAKTSLDKEAREVVDRTPRAAQQAPARDGSEGR